MDLTSLVSGAINIANQMTASLQVTISLKRWRGQTGSGEPLYPKTETYTVLLQRENHRMTSPEGQIITVNATKITFLQPLEADGTAGRKEPLDPRDLVIFPDKSEHQVIDVKEFINASTNAPFLSEAWVS